MGEGEVGWEDLRRDGAKLRQGFIGGPLKQLMDGTGDDG